MAKYLNSDDLANNPAARVPVCLCIDLSGSMGTVEEGTYKYTGKQKEIDGKVYDIVQGGISRIDKLQEGIQLFFDAIKDDDMAIDAAEVAIVGFSDDAKCVLNFNHIENQEIPKLCLGNDYTNMGEGVKLALKMLDDRKELYKSKGIQYYQPWLVIMTDGENNGDINELQEAIDMTVKKVNSAKLAVFPIGIGKDADMNTLAKFSPKRPPLRLKGLNFKEFFQWLSQSISRTSVSKQGERIVLPPVESWGTLDM